MEIEQDARPAIPTEFAFEHCVWTLAPSKLALIYYGLVYSLPLIYFLLSAVTGDLTALTEYAAVWLCAALCWALLIYLEVNQLMQSRQSASLVRVDAEWIYRGELSGAADRELRGEAYWLAATPWSITLALDCRKRPFSPHSTSIRHIWRDQLCERDWRLLMSYLALDTS